MAMINSTALDSALTYIINNTATLYLCNIADPVQSDFDTNKDGIVLAESSQTPTFSSPVNLESAIGTGRKITVNQTSGDVTLDGTAMSWALCYTNSSGTVTMVATGYLKNQKAVYAGDTFSLESFEIGIGHLI